MSESKPHSELPTVAECDERIAEAQHVIDHPDEYDVEVRVDASRDKSRWTFNRRFAERVASLEEQLEATEQRLAREISEHADAQAEYRRLVEQLEAAQDALYETARKFTLLDEAVRRLPRPDLRSGNPYADGVRNDDLAWIWSAMDNIPNRNASYPAEKPS